VAVAAIAAGVCSPDPLVASAAASSASIHFFDESIIAKRNRSAFTTKHPTPFLDDRRWDIQTMIKIPQPETCDLPVLPDNDSDSNSLAATQSEGHKRSQSTAVNGTATKSSTRKPILYSYPCFPDAFNTKLFYGQRIRPPHRLLPPPPSTPKNQRKHRASSVGTAADAKCNALAAVTTNAVNATTTVAVVAAAAPTATVAVMPAVGRSTSSESTTSVPLTLALNGQPLPPITPSPSPSPSDPSVSNLAPPASPIDDAASPSPHASNGLSSVPPSPAPTPDKSDCHPAVCIIATPSPACPSPSVEEPGEVAISSPAQLAAPSTSFAPVTPSSPSIHQLSRQRRRRHDRAAVGGRTREADGGEDDDHGNEESVSVSFPSDTTASVDDVTAEIGEEIHDDDKGQAASNDENSCVNDGDDDGDSDGECALPRSVATRNLAKASLPPPNL